jgi:hypothetical protein
MKTARLPRRTQDMPLHPPRSLPVLAAVLAVAGLMLTLAGCSHLTPLGPTPPQSRHLGSPIILQALRSQPATPAGGCPAGWAALSAPDSAGTCYRKLGTPVTITSAAISSVSAHGQPALYGFMIAVPAADVAAVTAIIKRAYNSRGALGVNVDGKTWSAPEVLQPFSGRQLQVGLPSRNQALQLYRMLVPSG